MVGLSSNSVMFSLTGENGRSYRIESSTDLVNWASELSFPIAPGFPNSTSIVINTNSPTVLTVTNNSGQKFFRARPYVLNGSDVEICVNHLREIRIAKLLWLESNAPTPVATPMLADLLPYFPHHLAPFCPDDYVQEFWTSYDINDLLTEPVCKIYPPTHFLEDPQ